MGAIVTFVPKAQRDAVSNMRCFVSLCRDQLTTFGTDLDFDKDEWDVTIAMGRRGTYCSQRIRFFKAAPGAKCCVLPLATPFKSFAKAYIRYSFAVAPTRNLGFRLRALRAIEEALLETGSADPIYIDANVLNRAAQLLCKQVSPVTAYQTANRLEQVSAFLTENYLTVVLSEWKHAVKKPDLLRQKIGRDGDKYRANKMPSVAALDALPRIFRGATDPPSVMVSSVCAILCSAPDRIAEVLTLPVQCEVSKENPGESLYGLRWWPAKGGEPMIKWILPSMSGVVREAVAKIRTITNDAREVAGWYEKTPEKIYLPKELEYLRGREWLSMGDVAEMLFSGPVSRNVAAIWCKSKGIISDHRGRQPFVRFADVEVAILKMMPRGFPVLDAENGTKYSEAMFVVLRNTMSTKKTAMRCVIEPISHGHIYQRLGARSTTGVKSVFDNEGYLEPDGTPIFVATHQFRHYLNTLAQAGGLSQLDVAKWSGRKDIRQNVAYDHEETSAKVERIRSAIGGDTRMFGPLIPAVNSEVINREDFIRLKVRTAHTTDFGYCVHDFVMTPCPVHRDCLNCEEQICLKGEAEKELKIRTAYAETEQLLSKAKEALADGDFGVEEWIYQYNAQLARLRELISIIDDPTIPEGAAVRLSVKTASKIEHAIGDRLADPDEDDWRTRLKITRQD